MFEAKRMKGSAIRLGAAAALVLAATAQAAGTTSPRALVEHYAAEAGVAPGALEAARGEALFRGEHVNAKGERVACASCHTHDPRDSGRTRVGKPIDPLAPAANPARFTDAAKVEKWFGRNCKDVLGRACTAQEKGAFISWLMTVK